jgi:CheY-like chemotaxis protein
MTGEKILVADDNRQIRMLVSATLRSGGYVTKPKLDGFEVLHFLHKRPDTADCKVIMLTTAGTAADIKHGIDEGACDYLVKPFQPANLREAVSKALGS